MTIYEKNPDLPNFELLCELLKKFNQADEEDAVWIINEMYEVEGYDEWLEWMEVNRKNELP